MSNALRSVSLAILSSLPLAALAADATGEIASDRVNLRARPSQQVEVVGQLNAGDRVTVLQVTNEWVEIVPPESVDVYVHKEFVKDGVVQVQPLTVRSGPGINYSKVGSMKKGDRVTARGEFGDWIKIAPPSGCSLWVSRPLVKLHGAAAAMAASQPAGGGTTATGVVAAVKLPAGADAPSGTPGAAVPVASTQQVVTVVAAPKPVPIPVAVPAAPTPIRAAQPGAYTPDDLRLAPVENQGQVVQREGVVKASLFVFNRPSKFQLVALNGNSVETICYLRGNEEQMNSFLEQRLRIRGRQFWVQGSRYPVVVVDQIALPPK